MGQGHKRAIVSASVMCSILELNILHFYLFDMVIKQCGVLGNATQQGLDNSGESGKRKRLNEERIV